MNLARLTRRITSAIIDLHAAALVRDCQALDRKAEKVVEQVEDAQTIAKWANKEVQRLKQAEQAAADAADAAWHAANLELSKLPRF